MTLAANAVPATDAKSIRANIRERIRLANCFTNRSSVSEKSFSGFRIYITMAGIYVWVGGSCSKNENLLNMLDTNTYIKTNPDDAYLVTKIQYTDGTNKADLETAKSDIDETSFDATFAIRKTNDFVSIGVYSTHEVRGGTSDDADAYAYYTYTDMSGWSWP